jgi:hypothetical protein
MQGKILIAFMLSTLGSTAALAGEPPKRQGCQRIEQPQQRLSAAQLQQQRLRAQECRQQRTSPPVVDPTPFFLL